MKTETLSFIKWAGGKKQSLDELSKHMPNKFDTYVEPFLGGGAVLFYILKNKHPKKVFAYDINKELVNTYIRIRDDPKRVISFLKKFQEEHNTRVNKKKYYYERRTEYNSKLRNLSKKAALFIYLNKTCYNGLYRVNALGEFNVPFGKYNEVKIFDSKNIIKISNLLRRVKIECLDFRKVKYPKNSLVYFDPPYWSEPKKNGFTSYTKINFKEKDQLELSIMFKGLHRKGLKLMLSNSDTRLIRNIYPKNIFGIWYLDSRRVINCDGKNRNIVKELLIKNYKNFNTLDL